MTLSFRSCSFSHVKGIDRLGVNRYDLAGGGGIWASGSGLGTEASSDSKASTVAALIAISSASAANERFLFLSFLFFYFLSPFHWRG